MVNNEPNKYICLIGTIHTDLEGPRRLEGILKRISPDIIALELSKDAEDLVELKNKMTSEEEERKTEEVLSNYGINLTRRQRETLLEGGRAMGSVTSYEFHVSRKYAQENPKTRLEYVDISLFENGKQEFIDGYVTAMKGIVDEAVKDKKTRKGFLKLLKKGKDNYLKQSQEYVDSTYSNREAIEQVGKLMRDPEVFEGFKAGLPMNAVQALEQIYSPKRDEFMAGKIRELYNNGENSVASVTGLYHLPGLISRLGDLQPISMTLLDWDDYLNKISSENKAS